jgi:ligand-binding SRPBCC domain-containing protein
MPIVTIETLLDAPCERAFDLSRSIDLHVATQTRHHERAVSGVTSGMIGLDQEVTWRARHFGFSLTLTSRIVQFDRPRHFRDSMVRGPFKRFDHDHIFEKRGEGTLMRDVFDFNSPFGILGKLVDTLVLERRLGRLLRERNAILKRVAESDEWKQYLS